MARRCYVAAASCSLRNRKKADKPLFSGRALDGDDILLGEECLSGRSVQRRLGQRRTPGRSRETGDLMPGSASSGTRRGGRVQILDGWLLSGIAGVEQPVSLPLSSGDADCVGASNLYEQLLKPSRTTPCSGVILQFRRCAKGISGARISYALFSDSAHRGVAQQGQSACFGSRRPPVRIWAPRPSIHHQSTRCRKGGEHEAQLLDPGYPGLV